MAFLTWYNVIFYIPLAIGILTILSVMLGIADLPHGLDLDGDGGPELDADAEADGVSEPAHDVEHDHGDSAAGRGILVLLGFGRAPVLVLLMSMTLIFGGTGVISNLALASLLKTSGAFVLVSVIGALVATFVLTSAIARLVNRLLPTLETTSVTKHDLVGCTGSLVLPSNATEGLVQITKDGDVYQIRCRSPEALARGTSVLVTGYDREKNIYSVTRNPLN